MHRRQLRPHDDHGLAAAWAAQREPLDDECGRRDQVGKDLQERESSWIDPSLTRGGEATFHNLPLELRGSSPRCVAAPSNIQLINE